MASAEVPPELQHKLMRLQQMRDQLQNVTLRKQQVELELREVEGALDELGKLPPETTVYKSTGILFYKSDHDKLVSELTDRKETLELRVKTLQHQEDSGKKQFEAYRKQVMDVLPGGQTTGTAE